MVLRVITLTRDPEAHAIHGGFYVIPGTDAGGSVRVRISPTDWGKIQQDAADLEGALTCLEHMAARSPEVIDDRFGGCFITVRVE